MVAKIAVPIERIENRILLVRGHKVLIDADLAALYGVETRVLNQAVKRTPSGSRPTSCSSSLPGSSWLGDHIL